MEILNRKVLTEGKKASLLRILNIIKDNPENRFASQGYQRRKKDYILDGVNPDEFKSYDALFKKYLKSN